MKINRIPSPTCKICGSYKIIMTDNGPECDECNHYMPVPNEYKHLGIDLSEDIEYLEMKKSKEKENYEAI